MLSNAIISLMPSNHLIMWLERCSLSNNRNPMMRSNEDVNWPWLNWEWVQTTFVQVNSVQIKMTKATWKQNKAISFEIETTNTKWTQWQPHDFTEDVAGKVHVKVACAQFQYYKACLNVPCQFEVFECNVFILMNANNFPNLSAINIMKDNDFKSLNSEMHVTSQQNHVSAQF